MCSRCLVGRKVLGWFLGQLGRFPKEIRGFLVSCVLGSFYPSARHQLLLRILSCAAVHTDSQGILVHAAGYGPGKALNMSSRSLSPPERTAARAVLTRTFEAILHGEIVLISYQQVYCRLMKFTACNTNLVCSIL